MNRQNDDRNKDDSQLRIDFLRCEQLGLRDRIQFDKGMGCYPATLKAVLLAVDSFAGKDGYCTAMAQTIGQRANLSTRTVGTALAILHREHLLFKQVRTSRITGHTQCRYQVSWPMVVTYCDEYEARQGGDETGTDEWAEVESTSDEDSSRPTAKLEGTNGKVEGGQRQGLGGPTANHAGGNGKPCRDQRQTTQGATANHAGTNGRVCRLTTHITTQEPPPQSQGRTEEEESFDLLKSRLSVSQARKYAKACDPETARKLIVEYDSAIRKKQLNGPGSIAHRLEHGQWPHPGVQTFDEIQEAEAKKAERTAKIAAQDLDCREKAIAAETAAADLESEFGPQLDGMPEADRLELAGEVIADVSYYVRHPVLYRPDLLERLAAKAIHDVV